MENADLIIKIMIGGFTVNFALLVIVWKHINTEIKDLKSHVLDIDRRLCRIEGGMAAKDCCMLKDNRTNEKAN